jgi:hypothetical protein
MTGGYVRVAAANYDCSCGAMKIYPGQHRTEKEGVRHGLRECVPLVGTPTFSCPACRWQHWLLGDTPLAQARALRDWVCDCTETTAGPMSGEAVGPAVPTDPQGDRAHAAELPSGTATSDRDGRPGLIARALSGVPAFARRRLAVTA